MTDYVWPGSLPAPAGFERDRRTPTASMRSPLTGSVQVSPRAGGRWILRCEWTVSGDDVPGLESLLTLLNGLENRLRLPMFDYYSGTKPNRGAWETNSAVVVDGAGQTGAAISLIEPGSINTPAFVREGDFFKFDNAVRMATSEADTDAAGRFTIDCWPPIRTSPPADRVVTIDPTILGFYRMVEYSAVPVFDNLASGAPTSTIGATFEDDVLA